MTISPEPRNKAEILQAGVGVLGRRLPPGWTFRLLDAGAADQGIDGVLVVTAPDGSSSSLTLQAKRILEGRDVATLRERFVRSTEQIPGSGGVVVARYLSPTIRDRLVRAGLSFIDATGNVRLQISHPGLYIADRGADRDPWRGPGRPRGTLKGPPAAKVVRALLDFRRSWTIRELVEISGTSTGSTYRVIDFLETEGLAVREESGKVAVPDWPALLRRWSEDYGFVRSSRVTRWIAPRGLGELMTRVSGSPARYAVTGTLAAAEWSSYAPARSAMIYTADAARAAESWNLRPAEAGANVMLAEPEGDFVFTRALTTAANTIVAAPSQVSVDLMTGPGRSPAEAEELIEWMIRNESSWRG